MQQFQAAHDKWQILLKRNLSGKSVSRPPRYFNHTDETWRTWWINAPTGLDLSASSYAYNGNVTHGMTDVQKRQYATRFLGGKDLDHTAIVWLSNAPNRANVIQRIADPSYFSTSSRLRDWRVDTCEKCGEVAMGSHNIRHRCTQGQTGLSQADIKQIKPVATGLHVYTMIYPHDLINHPVHGYKTWTECAEHEYGTEAGLAAYLATLGLVQIDAAAVLQQQWDTVRSFITSIDDLDLGAIVCQENGADSRHNLVMAVDRYIQSKAEAAPPLGGDMPATGFLDNGCSYDPGVARTINHMKASKAHLALYTCSASPSYGYRIAEPHNGAPKHECPSLYGPLMTGTGKT